MSGGQSIGVNRKILPVYPSPLLFYQYSDNNVTGNTLAPCPQVAQNQMSAQTSVGEWISNIPLQLRLDT